LHIIHHKSQEKIHKSQHIHYKKNID
jgi:hypothetical protein